MNKHTMHRKRNYRIYWLFLSAVCMNPSVHSSNAIQSQISPHVNPPTPLIATLYTSSTNHSLNSPSNEITSDSDLSVFCDNIKFGPPPFIDPDAVYQHDCIPFPSVSSDTKSPKSTNISNNWLLSIPDPNPSTSSSLNTSGNQLSNIFTTDNGYNGVQNNSILYTSSTFAINSQPESRNIPKLDNNVSTASSLKKRKRKIELDGDLSQQNLSKKSKKDTLIQEYPPLASSNSTFKEKKVLYEKMLKETQTQFEAAFNLQGQYHHYESFKVIFSKLLPNIKENYSCEYDRVQIYVYILKCLGYTIREIALLSQIDGYLSLGYLPPRAPSSFERIVQGLKLTDDQRTLVQNHLSRQIRQSLNLTKDQRTLVQNHLSRHKNMNKYYLKPKIGWIYKQYKQIFTKRRTHSKLVSQMK